MGSCDEEEGILVLHPIPKSWLLKSCHENQKSVPLLSFRGYGRLWMGGRGDMGSGMGEREEQGIATFFSRS